MESGEGVEVMKTLKTEMEVGEVLAGVGKGGNECPRLLL